MATNLVVKPRRNENIERAIKRFSKKVNNKTGFLIRPSMKDEGWL